MFKNSVRDQHIDHLLKRVFIAPIQMIQAQVTGASVLLVNTADGSATPALEAQGATLFSALKLEATTEFIQYMWKLPYDFDNRHRLLIRHRWTSAYGTANGTATFTTLYTALKDGDVPAVGATALTKVHTAATKTAATAYASYWSPYGSINPIATGTNAYMTFHPDTEFVAFKINVSAVSGITIASDFVFYQGLELVYTPRITFGDGNHREGRLLHQPLGYAEAGSLVDF